MRKIGFALLLIMVLQSSPSPAQSIFEGAPNAILRQIRAASNRELSDQVDLVAGQSNNWKTNNVFWGLVKKIPIIQRWLEKRHLSDADFISFSNVLQTGNSRDSLRNAFLIASRSRDPELRALAVTLKGEKRHLLDNTDSYMGRRDLESFLFFLINMQNGDTFFEKGRFSRFGKALQPMSIALDKAVESSLRHPLAVVLIELTTSSLDGIRSPIMSLFSDMVLRGPILSMTSSPDGGKIVAVDPARAADLAKELGSMAKNLDYTIRKMRYQLDSDKVAREQLLEILRTGAGIVSDRPLFCSALFNFF